MLILLLFPTIAISGCLPQFQVSGIGVECRYACDDPICHAVCQPNCNAPVCTISCDPGHSCLQTIPVCSTRCTTDIIPSDSCPACETICNPLLSICTDHCHVLCEAPLCTWTCEKPTNCQLPICELACERPACESPTPQCSNGSIATWSLVLMMMIFLL